MLTISIKEHLSPSWKKFDLLLSSATRDNKIGHIFVVDIEFDKKKKKKNMRQQENFYIMKFYYQSLKNKKF